MDEENVKIVIDNNATSMNVFSELVFYLDEILEKVKDLESMYQDKLTKEEIQDKIHIQILNKAFDINEQSIITKLIESKVKYKIIFEKEKEQLGLYSIDKTYERSIDISETKYIKGSLRSGVREEFSGSIVLLGDLNSGAEIIAGGNVIIVGTLRGVAHAGANGNSLAFISASETEKTQVRIANEVQEIGEYKRCPFFFIEQGKIHIDYKEKKDYKVK